MAVIFSVDEFKESEKENLYTSSDLYQRSGTRTSKTSNAEFSECNEPEIEQGK